MIIIIFENNQIATNTTYKPNIQSVKKTQTNYVYNKTKKRITIKSRNLIKTTFSKEKNARKIVFNKFNKNVSLL